MSEKILFKLNQIRSSGNLAYIDKIFQDNSRQFSPGMKLLSGMYLSSVQFYNYLLNVDDLDCYICDKNSFLYKLFEPFTESKLNIFQTAAMKQIYQIVMSKPGLYKTMSMKIKAINYLFQNDHFRNYVFKNHWSSSSSSSTTSNISFIELLMKSFAYRDTAQLTELLNFMNKLMNTYENQYFEWIKYIVQKNRNNKKMINIIHKNTILSSDKFLIHILHILIEQLKYMTKKSPTTTTTIQPNCFEWNDKTNWNKNCRHKDFKWPEVQVQLDKFNKLYVAVTRLIDIAIIPLILNYNYKKHGIEKINNMIQLEQDSFQWKLKHPSEKNKYLQELKSRKTRPQQVIDSIHRILRETCIISNIVYVNDMTVGYILKQDVNYYKINFPKILLENIGVFLYYYDDLSLMKLFTGLNFTNILKIFVNILNKNSYSVTPSTQNHFLNFQIINNSEITTLIETKQPITLFKYMQSLVAFYIQVDKLKHTYLFNRYLAKQNINSGLMVFIEFYVKHQHNKKHNKNISLATDYIKTQIFLSNIKTLTESKNFSQYVFLLIMDNLNYFEESIKFFEQIQELEMQINKPYLAFNEKMRIEDAIFRNVTNLKLYLSDLNENFKLLELLSNSFPEYLLNDICGNKLITLLIFPLHKSFNSKNKKRNCYKYNKFNNNLSFLMIYKFIYNIFHSLSDDTTFIEQLFLNHQSSSYEILSLFPKFKKIILQIEHDNSEFKYDDNGKISLVLDQLSKMIEENKEQPIIEYPSEFCDPLLMTPFKHPYLLPESKNFIDKNTILSHLMLYKNDPFTRSPLDIEELEKFNDLPETKQRVQELMNKFMEWKKKQGLGK